MSEQPNSNWWQRNWKWFVPIGCLTTLLIMAGGLAMILSLAFGLMKSSDVYAEALARARADQDVIEALGQPIKEGWFTGGNINVNGPSGEAALSIPVSGPQGEGTIFLEARKSSGRWTFSTLVVALDADGSRIDLLEDAVESEAN
ncbi:MAG: cytochrome c oxidase assembly factor Coa1 family protein [Pseudomarimonas sp.]